MADRRNNFDLIRLVAACQVLLGHAFLHFGMGETPFAQAISYFPGVPVFFAISGYLVAQSLERSGSLTDYAAKRARRIFPPLWGALVFSAVAIMLLHPIDAGTFVLWIAAQATIGQNWHPEALRTFGVGVVNGSLWSVCVEMALYAALPLLIGLRTRWLVLLGLASFAALYAIVGGLAGFWLKLGYVSPAGWAGMFIAGMLLHRHAIRPRLRVWLPLFALSILAAELLPVHVLLRATGNDLGLLNFAALTGLVFALAWTRPVWLTADLSYGLYLYHMPVLNVAVALGMSGTAGVAATIFGSVALAAVSWQLIERRHAGAMMPWAMSRSNAAAIAARDSASTVAPPEGSAMKA